MDIIMLAAAFSIVVLIAALAVAFGVDSRIESTDPRRSPYPVGIDV